jgi:RHS repeat-associated protein
MQYQYDGLNRLVGTTSNSDVGLRHFYCKKRLATEIQGVVRLSVFQQGDLLLAQHMQVGVVTEASLMATDQMRSVLQITKANSRRSIAYSPYGHRPAESGLLSLLGFNGERADSITGHYFLGNGYRAFNPVLLRFNSPDNLSPFGKGGLNPYVYCLGDPINREDSSGHVSWLRGIDATLSMIDKGAKALSKFAKKVKASKGREVSGAGNVLGGRETPKILKNKVPFLLKSEYREFNAFQEEMNKSLVKTIASRKDANTLVHNYDYKFVFTDQQQLIVGGSPGTQDYHYLSHPVLSQYSSSPRITSAGYITNKGNNIFEIDNHTGHYVAPFETLHPVRQYLKNLGVEAELIRLH